MCAGKLWELLGNPAETLLRHREMADIEKQHNISERIRLIGLPMTGTVISEYARWLYAILKSFEKPDRAPLRFSILATVASRVANLVAFLLPLKIILLISSDGVPGYFHSLIDPTQKAAGVLLLSVVAVGSFLFALVAESFAKRRLRHVSTTMQSRKKTLTLFKSEEEKSEKYLGRICESLTDLISTTVFFSLGMVLAPLLFAALSVVIIVQLWASLVCLETFPSHRFSIFVRTETNSYLARLASTDFILVFLMLLGVFVFGASINPLVAIACLLVSRQLLASLRSLGSNAAVMAPRQAEIESLLTSNKTLPPSFEAQSDIESERLHVRNRTRRVAEQLGVATDCVTSRWRDTGNSQEWAFDIDVRANQRTIYLREHLYGAKRIHLAKNESLLFDLTPSEAAEVLRPLAEYEVGDGIARLIQLPEGYTPIPHSCWRELRKRFIHSMWNTAPSSELIKTFVTAKALLPDRLSQDRLSLLEMAIDTREESLAYSKLKDLLPEMVERLRELPLFVFNTQVSHRNVIIDRHKHMLATSWTEWTLEPIGVGMATSELCTSHHGQRDLFAREISAEFWRDSQSLAIADLAWSLDASIGRGNYAEGLTLARQLVKYVQTDSYLCSN